MTNLKKIRQDKGLTQAELAKAADINLRTYQDYEQGSKSINQIALTKAIRIADALGVDVKAITEQN